MMKGLFQGLGRPRNVGEIDQWYDDYYARASQDDPKPWYDGARILMAEFVGATIEHKNIVEIGCGSGQFLASLGLGKQVGIDVSGSACNLAATRGVRCTVAQAEAVPLRADWADIVIICEVIEHVRSPEAAIREIRRVLRQDGLLIVSTPNYLNLPWLATRILGDLLRKPNWLVRQPIDRVRNIFAIRREFRAVGFVHLATIGCVLEPPGIFHWRRKRGKSPLRSRLLGALAFHPVMAFRLHKSLSELSG